MRNYFGQQGSSKSAEIIPFPSANSLSSSGTNIEASLIDIFTDPTIKTHLKTIIEGAIMDILVKSYVANFEVSDNPFDAIYISELKADHITCHDVEKIANYLNIIDLSNTISFDDEWED